MKEMEAETNRSEKSSEETSVQAQVGLVLGVRGDSLLGGAQLSSRLTFRPLYSLLRSVARCTNSAEPVALASVLETVPGAWLCNVQSQPWPTALGCPSLVIRAAHVFRQPGGQRWVEVGSQESIKDPLSPILQPLVGGKGKGELLTTVEVPPLPTLKQPPLSNTSRLLQRNHWEAGIPKLGLLSFLPSGLGGPVTRGLAVSRMSLDVVTPTSGSCLEAT